MIEWLEVCDFRVFSHARFEPAPEGTTAVIGPNGTGKTSLLEALGYLGTGVSFRRAPKESLVRTGAERAIVRSQAHQLVEAEIVLTGRSRTQVDRQRLGSSAQLRTALPVTIFSPDDLEIVKGGPARRREFLDHLLVAPLDELGRVLRQRGALLRQSRGRLSPEIESTLEIWDARLADVGTEVAEARASLVASLEPPAEVAYRELSGEPSHVELVYQRSWEGDLLEALLANRREDLQRGVTSVGPHRDELAILLDGRQTRHESSQGEARSLAIALRLAGHELSEHHPTLLLDDVFSELDEQRVRRLVEMLPEAQAVLSSTGVPSGVEIAKIVQVRDVLVP